MKNELILVLSGDICHPQSADMLPFWCGFIELQRKLCSSIKVSQIVGHSWNPELSDLVELVYAPQAKLHEQQSCSYPELLELINSAEGLKKGRYGLSADWNNESIRSTLNRVRSLSRAVQLMDAQLLSEHQVLIARWDLGPSNKAKTDQLVIDAGLPKEYLYLQYSSKVDVGYADIWMLAPPSIARQFSKFDRVVLDSLTGKNSYLKQFCKSGWPRTCRRTWFETALSHSISQSIHDQLLKLIESTWMQRQGRSFTRKILRRMITLFQSRLDQPPQTAENSYVPIAQNTLRTFSPACALNPRALLKYFILSEGLRERTRFLTNEDFEIASNSGQVINPQPIVLLLWDEVQDNGVIKHAMHSSALPISAIFYLEGTVKACITEQREGVVSRVLQPKSSSSKDRLSCVLDFTIQQFGRSSPVVIMPSAAIYNACADWHYLNALIKFIVWKNLDYVDLTGSENGKPSLEFPDLQTVNGGSFPLFNMAAGTAIGMRSILNKAPPELKVIPNWLHQTLQESSVIAVGRAIF